MKQLFSFLFFLLLVFSCKNDNQQVEIKSTVINFEDEALNDFEKFIELVPETKLPKDIICGFRQGAEIDFSNLEFRLPTGLHVVSKIPFNSDKMLILYFSQGDILYPYIYSYDSVGQVIDSLVLHNGFCATDPWLVGETWTRIDENVNIEMFDTLKYFSFNDPERYLDSIIVTINKYAIGKNGYFVPVSEKREKLKTLPSNQY